MGGAEYAKLGVENTRGHAGRLRVGQRRQRGGNFEIDAGISLRDLIYDLAGGIAGRPGS